MTEVADRRATAFFDVVRDNADRDADRVAYRFLEPGHRAGAAGTAITQGELDRRARAVAVALGDLGAGRSPALLVLPPGIGFLAAFYGCLYAGVPAVPCPVPGPGEEDRLARIARDSGAGVLLTEAGVAPAVEGTARLDVAAVPGEACGTWRPPAVRGDDLVLLMYSSGSTGDPKAIAVSSDALLAQIENFRALAGLPAGGDVVDWLPVTHALGLGHLLLAQFTGGQCVFLTPEDFVAEPGRWLAAISGLDGPVLSGGPTFAYARCNDLIGPGERDRTSLGGWQAALVGGERIRPATLERFAETFAPCGFRREAFFPAYGLTEAMQIVVAHRGGAPSLAVDAAALDRGRVRLAGDDPDARHLVPCGRPGPGARVLVVDPEDRTECGDGTVGEIWVAGGVVCPGYWRRPEATAETFGGRLASGDGPYLRTGDLGFRHAGELYVCGRLKELVIVNGRNLHPQDIEETARRAHPALDGPGAAFSVDGEHGEELVVIQPYAPDEPAGGTAPAELAEAARAVKSAVARAHEVEPREVLVVEPDALPRTALGKVRRAACREAYLAGRLRPRARASAAAEPRPAGPRPAGPADARALVRALPPDRRAPVIEAEVLRRVADVLDAGPGDLAVDTPLVALGLESVRSISLRQALERDFGVTVAPSQVLGGTVETLARDIGAALGDTAAGPAAPPTPWPEAVDDPGHRFDPFPLTDLQQAYLVGRASSFDLGGSSIHLYAEHHAPTGLDADRLRAALDRLVARHEMLRAVITPDGRQRILPEAPPVTVPEYDLRGAADGEVAAHLERVRAELDHQVLALDRWPPFDIRITWLPGGTARVHVSLDLVCFDVASVRLFFLEWGDLYRDLDAPLPSVLISFRDFVLAAARLRETDDYRRSRDYWRARAAALPPAPPFPVLSRPADGGPPRRRRWRHSVDAARWRRLRDRAAALGVTPSALLLAAYSTVLGAWSGSRHFTVDVPLFSRFPLHPDVDHILGDFTNVTLLEVDLRPGDGVAGLAGRLQRRLWQDVEHRFYSGTEVMRDAQRAQGLPAGAFASVVFASVREHGRDQEFTQGEWGSRWLGDLDHGITQTPQVLLDHQVYEEDGALTFNWDAVEAAFPAGFVDAMFGAYRRLLTALADDEGAWEPDGFDLLPPGQRRMIEAANDTAGPLPGGLLHSGIAEQARVRPDEPAVITAARTLTFGDLWAHAGRIAARLRGLGAGPGRLVGVCLPKSAEQIAAVVGVLRSGAAYLPIDPELPRRRRDFMLEHGEAGVVLVPPDGGARPWPAGVAPVAVDLGAPVTGGPDDAPGEAGLDAAQRPTDLAYVLYTSGSTGTPKGVAQTHRATLNTLADASERMGAGPGDRALGLSQLGFDLSVWDVFGALGAGAALVLPEPGAARDPERWAALMAEHRVTLWNSVPALMRMLVEHLEDAGEAEPRATAALRAVWFSGDWIPLDLPDRVRALAPRARVIASGGPTETAIWCVAYPVGRVDPEWDSIPYGRPMRNHTIHILDEGLRPCPVWVPGQMYIGGAGLAEGYWRDPERTRAAFVTHPRTGERLYRSGDLGRWRPDGTLEILGRDDFQVKINGYRIELGEIENALAAHPAVRQAVVTADRSRRRIVAFVTANGGAPDGTNPAGGTLGGTAAAPAGPTAAAVAVAPDGPATLTPGSGGAMPAAPGGDGQRALVAASGPDGGAAPAASAGPGTAPVSAPDGETTAAGDGDPGYDAAVTDPMERLAFKARRIGRRTDLEGERIPLPPPAPDAVAGRRASHRSFADRPVTREELGGLLGVLCSRTDGALPKYRYGSAGSLYPVQVYLYVPPGRVTGLPAGAYYHDPETNELVPTRAGAVLDAGVQAESNRALFEAASFAVFLVAQRRAIEPLYGRRTRDFCLLEAGLMTQSMELAAAGDGLGLCQVGLVRDTPALRAALALDEGHEVLHGLVGGPRADDPPGAGPAGTAGANAPAGRTDGAGGTGDTNGADDAGRAAAGSGGTVTARTAGMGEHGADAGGPSPAARTEGAGGAAAGVQVELRAHLAARLPRYMVPSAIHVVDRLPLTSRGKVDRMALRELAETARADEPADRGPGPESETERTMVAVFREALETDQVSVVENFTDLGADSATIVKVHRRLKGALGREFPLLTMFEFPTIRRLAAHLSGGGPDGQDTAPSAARAGFERARRRARRRRGGDGRREA